MRIGADIVVTLNSMSKFMMIGDVISGDFDRWNKNKARGTTVALALFLSLFCCNYSSIAFR